MSFKPTVFKDTAVLLSRVTCPAKPCNLFGLRGPSLAGQMPDLHAAGQMPDPCDSLGGICETLVSALV